MNGVMMPPVNSPLVHASWVTMPLSPSLTSPHRRRNERWAEGKWVTEVGEVSGGVGTEWGRAMPCQLWTEWWPFLPHRSSTVFPARLSLAPLCLITRLSRSLRSPPSNEWATKGSEWVKERSEERRVTGTHRARRRDESSDCVPATSQLMNPVARTGTAWEGEASEPSVDPSVPVLHSHIIPHSSAISPSTYHSLPSSKR